MSAEARPPVALVDVDGFHGDHLTASRADGSAFFAQENDRQLVVRSIPGIPDFARARVAGREQVR